MTTYKRNKHIIFALLVVLVHTLGGCNRVPEQPTPSELQDSKTQIPAVVLPTNTTIPIMPTIQATKTVKPSAGWQVVAVWPGMNNIRTILSTSDGSIWAGGPEALTRWNPETDEAVTYVFDPNLPDYNSKVVDLAETTDKSIWVATFGYGLSRFRDEKWEIYTKDNAITNNYLSSVTASKDGRLWVNISFYTRDRGDNVAEWDTTMKFMNVYDGEKWTTLAQSLGFFKIRAGMDGSIWGLTYWDGKPNYWSRTDRYVDGIWNEETIHSEVISTIYSAPDGSFWIATDNSLYKYSNQQWHKIAFPDLGESHPRVSSIAISKNNVIWLGFSLNHLDDVYKCGDRINTGNEIGVYRYDGKSWTHFTTADGLVDNKICAITIDNKDRVWIGSYDKGISMFDGQKWRSYFNR